MHPWKHVKYQCYTQTILHTYVSDIALLIVLYKVVAAKMSTQVKFAVCTLYKAELCGVVLGIDDDIIVFWIHWSSRFLPLDLTHHTHWHWFHNGVLVPRWRYQIIAKWHCHLPDLSLTPPLWIFPARRQSRRDIVILRTLYLRLRLFGINSVIQRVIVDGAYYHWWDGFWGLLICFFMPYKRIVYTHSYISSLNPFSCFTFRLPHRHTKLPHVPKFC